MSRLAPRGGLSSPAKPDLLKRPRRSQRGFGAIAIVMMLVLLAAIAAAVVRLATAQQIGSAQEQNAARAAQAARAGIEWGLYQAFQGSWKTCASASQTLDLSADLGMRVAVSCSSSLYNEGESAPGTPQTVRIYTVEAVACNAGGSCPDASRVSSPAYVERRLQIQASD
jgi:MSHA biogenesis protein MshP